MRGGLATVVLLASACALASPGRAMSVTPPSFGTLVSEADSILRIQVTAVGCRWDETPKHGKVIHTYVECRVLQTLKGLPSPTITLRMLGGQVGNVGMRIPDMPAFQAGGTYIVFIEGNGRMFCPLVGVRYGVYRVAAAGLGRTEEVIRADGTPLLSIADVRRPMEQAPPTSSKAMSPQAFEAAIAARTEEVLHSPRR